MKLSSKLSYFAIPLLLVGGGVTYKVLNAPPKVEEILIPENRVQINFLLSEFNISGECIPEDVADKILQHHIVPMQRVRNKINIPIWASVKSSYRDVNWEIYRGRNGASEHVFAGKGAVDWTCADYENNKDIFLEAVLKYTEYNRIAIYDNYIHCDYKETASGKREIYNSNWQLQK